MYVVLLVAYLVPVGACWMLGVGRPQPSTGSKYPTYSTDVYAGL
jgi:hypothetical protein